MRNGDREATARRDSTYLLTRPTVGRDRQGIANLNPSEPHSKIPPRKKKKAGHHGAEL